MGPWSLGWVRQLRFTETSRAAQEETARALIVYWSMFGNTEQVARAVAAGMQESLNVRADVSETPTEAAEKESTPSVVRF